MKKFILSAAAIFAKILPVKMKQWFYEFAPLAKLIRGSLNLAAPSGVTDVTVSAGEVAGFKMNLDL